MTARISRRLMLGLGAAAVTGFGLRWSPALAQSTLERVTVGIEPLTTLDPHRGRATRGDLAISSQIYSSLTTVNEDGELVGDLALSWELTSPTEWTFTLRDDAAFEDGSPLNAEVIVWNLTRMLRGPNGAMPAATGMQLVADFTAPNPTTLVITTSATFLDLPRRLAWTYFLSPAWAEANDPATAAMGSGPYTLVSWDRAGDTVLVRNEAYYGTKPDVLNPTYRVIPNEATRLAALQSGELDAAFGVDPISLPQLQAVPGLTAGAIDANKSQCLRINFAAPHMDDLRVRQAINYAINKEAITRSVYQGLVGPGSAQVLGPLYEGYEPDRPAWPYDPDRARALLAEAGLGGGFTLKLGNAETGYVGSGLATQAIAAQLAQVGIIVEIETVPYANWVTYLRDEAGPALTFLSFGSQSVSSPEILAQFISAGPYSHGPVPQGFDEAQLAATSAATQEDKLTAIAECVRIMADEAMLVFLWPQPQTYAIADRLNWKPRMDDWVRVSDIHPA